MDPDAKPGRPYHPSYVPRSQGRYRIDSASAYDVLYLSDEPAAAIAEAFGAYQEWGEWMFEHPRGFTRRLVTFGHPGDTILDLDDPAELVSRGLRPSRVVTRDRDTTQAWALSIHNEAGWSGVSWWSYYSPEWTSLGLWCPPETKAIPDLTVLEVTTVDVGLEDARTVLARTWSTESV